MRTSMFMFVPLALFTCSSLAQPLYNVVPIPSPVGLEAYSVNGRDLNSQGVVVGWYGFHRSDGVTAFGAFIYADGQGTTDISLDGKRGTMARGINDTGQIAISTAEEDGTWREMYRYTPGAGLQPLGTLGGVESETQGINASGQITGYSDVSGQSNLAFRDTPGSGIESLGSLYGGGSSGYDINDRGWVVGAGDGQNAFLYRDDVGMTYITAGVAYGINNAGTVVGAANQPGDGVPQAFIYVNGELRLLGPTGRLSVASDVNSSDVVVGVSDLRATIWTEANGQQNLNSLIDPSSGWTLITAAAINDNGQITGEGELNGVAYAYRLDPIPEPSTWALLGLGGLLSMIFHRKLKR